MKMLAMVTLIIFLSACAVPPNSGGRPDPAMDSIVAGATQTAANVRIQQTETARRATQAAAFVRATQAAQATERAREATQAAVYAQATGTAVAVASQTAAAATATTQRQNEIDALIGEETRIALIALGTRQAIESEATAVAMQRDMYDDLVRRERNRLWGSVAIGGLTLLALAALGVIIRRIARGAEPFFNDSGQLVAVERPFGGIVVLLKAQRALPERTTIEGDAQPPVNNQRPQARRQIPGSVNGRPATFSVDEDDGVKPETWRSMAIALLVHCANFSRTGVTTHTASTGFRYGKVSQPEYNKAYQHMDDNNYLVPGGGTENDLTQEGYDWLARWVPDNMDLVLPYPEITAANLQTR